MKINPKHNKKVKDAVHLLRKTLVEQTIELMKLIGVDGYMVFDHTLIMHQRINNGLMETIIADRISYNESSKGSEFLMLNGPDDNCNSSLSLSVSNLEIVYNEVYRTVRKY